MCNDDYRYEIYGIQVFDPTKMYIMPIVIPSSIPWYKRMWRFIKGFFTYQTKNNYGKRN